MRTAFVDAGQLPAAPVHAATVRHESAAKPGEACMVAVAGLVTAAGAPFFLVHLAAKPIGAVL